MSRKKSKSEKKVHGTDRKDRDKMPKGAKLTEEECLPPGPLSGYEEDIWEVITSTLNEKKLLAKTDLHMLYVYAKELGRYMKCAEIMDRDGEVISTEKGEKETPYFGISQKAITTARMIAKESGLTVRSKLALGIDLEEEKSDSKIMELLRDTG